MTCRIVTSSDGAVTAIHCSRGSPRPRCQTTGCKGPAVALCDFPLTGPKTGQTCSRRLCAQCRRAVGPDADYCLPHFVQVQTKQRATP